MSEPQETSTEGSNMDGAVDVTSNRDGGIMKIVKRVGDPKFGHPLTGDKVFVHYVGTLTNGKQFDSSRDRGEHFTFTIGKGEVIKAWDHGVATMCKGELAVFTCKAEYAYGDTGAGADIGPGETLIFEVELFDWKGDDISPDKDEGILRSTIEKGSGYSSPKDGAQCEVHVTGRFNGTVFEDRDVSFVMGEGSEQNLILGVEEAVKKFKSGEKSSLKIASHYAYGTEGNKDYNIPPNADLEYEVKLKSFEKAKETWEMDTAEKLEQSAIMKEKGTKFFKSEKYTLALNYYKKIVDCLGSEDSLEGEDAVKAKTLLLAGHLNSAMCHLKMNNNQNAIESCDKTLGLEPNNEKALFRKGTALMNQHDYPEARHVFEKVLEIDPNNKAAKNQITIALVKIQQLKDKEKKTYVGMFQKFAEADAKREQAQKSKEEKESPKPSENGVDSTENADKESPVDAAEEMDAEQVTAEV